MSKQQKSSLANLSKVPPREAPAVRAVAEGQILAKQEDEARVVVTFQLRRSLDEELEVRAFALRGKKIRKRDIIERGIEMALASDEFKA